MSKELHGFWEKEYGLEQTLIGPQNRHGFKVFVLFGIQVENNGVQQKFASVNQQTKEYELINES